MATTWIPKFTLDLTTASANAFGKLLEDFEAYRQTVNPLPDLDLSNGWKDINQQTAEAMLLRNPLSANRRPALPTVKYYARLMRESAWKKTGQPVIFDTDGILKDAGHRLWASYLSGATFPTFLVGDVPADGTLFAYIDNGKARSASDALSTAGLNGLSRQLSAIINMAMHYEAGCFTASTAKRAIDKVAPIEIVHYAQEHANLRLAARLMAGEHSSAAGIIGYKDVAAFAAFLILETHGEEVLDQFMQELGHVSDDVEEGSPVVALQKVIEEDEASREPMKKHQVLGHIIKAFNSWINREQVRKITLRVNETFPRLVRAQPVQQAAE